MHALLDHLTAATAGAVVLMLLLAAGLLRQEEGMHRTVRYGEMGRTQALQDLLERDLNSALSLSTTGAESGSFHFTVSTDPLTGATEEVEYRLVPGKSTHLVERWADGELTATLGPVLDWEVQALDETGSTTGTPSSTRALAVRAVFPVADAQPDLPGRGAVWETTVWPYGLQSDSP